MHEQRLLFDDTLSLLNDLEMLPDDITALQALRRQLDELFLLVVVGEFNAGKSTFLNALLGEPLLETGELPTTRQVHLLKYGPVDTVRESETGLLIHELPSELLRDLNIVDTPGTNSMQRDEQLLTEKFVPRADLVFFVTSVVRPYTASENAFVELMRGWGKQILFVINQVDLAEGEVQVERVKRYVQQQALESLGDERPVYAISAREVLRNEAPSPFNEYVELERYVKETLAAHERVRLKLLAPLESLETSLSRAREALSERIRLVQGDRLALEGLLEEIVSYEKRMKVESSRYQSEMTNVLWGLEKRGNRFFDELVRLSNLLRLRDKDVVENRFRNEVVADTPQRIEEEIQSLIDWLVRQNLAMWEKADGVLQKRRKALKEVAERTRWLSPEYVYNREEIFTNLAKPVKKRLEAFDAREEADRIVGAVNEAIAKTFGLQAVVLGLGAVLTAAFTTLTIDVTGTIGATLLAVAGLFILPHRRARLKKELSAKVEGLRQEMSSLLESKFEAQLSSYVQQLRETFSPELETAQAQEQRLNLAQKKLGALQESTEKIKRRIPR